MQQDDERYSVEVTGLKRAVTRDALERTLHVVGLVSVSYTEGSGKCVLEISSRANAEVAVRRISAIRDTSIVYSPPGQAGRTLRASMKTSTSATFTEKDVTQRWAFCDDTAKSGAEQDASNEADLAGLFARLDNSGMRASLKSLVEAKASDGLVLKEMHLAVGRRCELVFAGSRGQKDQCVVRSQEETLVLESHLAEFKPLFAGLPDEARRTGIDHTLHRISRSVHAIAKTACSVTARVGRTIQGTVLPMLVDSAAVEPLEALAQACSRGLLIIGQPNVGKTTFLRELARLLAHGEKRIVVIVDKSMEIAGTGVVPHAAIGNARVLTVERPELQDKVMIEAVENQSPDIVIVDELTNKEQCNAARTITGRGVAVVATVHGDGLASLMNDHDRSLLLGGIASVTLSAKEAEARPDKLRQVNRRTGAAVFGAALELRGYHDLIIHDDLETAIDKYLDFVPFGASHRVREGAEVVATPLVGCRQQGSTVGFGYAKLQPGETIGSADGGGVNFAATDPVSGQRVWTETAGPGSKIFERTRGSGAQPGFRFGAAPPPGAPTGTANGGVGGGAHQFQFGGAPPGGRPHAAFGID